MMNINLFLIFVNILSKEVLININKTTELQFESYAKIKIRDRSILHAFYGNIYTRNITIVDISH